mmetsp:Transcript_15886/g.39455  ORF Transcript_15886/g.39455 Transcript_15886/m.39455 type:complete len:457 (-) Transcript_15886:183-1553(-)
MTSKNKRTTKDTSPQSVYVLSVISVDHSLNYVPEQRTVGVYCSKANACIAAGSVTTDYGTFDDAIESMFTDDRIDNRNDPPDKGIVIQLGSKETGEGDYVRLIIESFPLDAGVDTAATMSEAESKPEKRKAETATASVATKKKAKTETKSSATKKKKPKKESIVVAREIDEAGLMVIMKDVMKRADHKRVLKKIQNLQAEMEAEAAPLRQTDEHIFSPDAQPENLFEKHVGDFWGMYGTRDYMRAHLALADEIHDQIAVKYDVPSAWEVVIWHYQELMRLSSSDNLGIRYRFPFLLLQLDGREDDAFCFIRYWVQLDESGKREKRHKESNQGEWLYGHKVGARFQDIFKICPKANFQYVSLPLLGALACIKTKLIAIHSDERKQKTQLNELLKLIHQRNPTVLPAVINPKPLLSREEPIYLSPGTPEEAYSIVKDANPIWCKTEGALEHLQEFLGA